MNCILVFGLLLSLLTLPNCKPVSVEITHLILVTNTEIKLIRSVQSTLLINLFVSVCTAFANGGTKEWTNRSQMPSYVMMS